MEPSSDFDTSNARQVDRFRATISGTRPIPSACPDKLDPFQGDSDDIELCVCGWGRLSNLDEEDLDVDFRASIALATYS